MPTRRFDNAFSPVYDVAYRFDNHRNIYDVASPRLLTSRDSTQTTNSWSAVFLHNRSRLLHHRRSLWAQLPVAILPPSCTFPIFAADFSSPRDKHSFRECSRSERAFAGYIIAIGRFQSSDWKTISLFKVYFSPDLVSNGWPQTWVLVNKQT